MRRDLQVAWAAGFFDGEGHICISFRRAASYKTYGTYHYPRYTLFVSAAQVVRAPIERLVELFGGRVRESIAKRSYDRGTYHRWDWSISTNKAAAALREMQPYLIVKAAEADIALQFQATMGRSRQYVGPEADKIVALRKACFDELRAVRKRAGPSEHPSLGCEDSRLTLWLR